jgi:3-deoxy-manno-octulosonate cytidylyltransferase (CMP-KDO synthetase)
MKIVGVIPARYGSTRFPGKPLALIGGVTMIERVWRQAKLATFLSDVIVATDDTRISEHVLAFGGKVEMTRTDHRCGTDRIGEIANRYKTADCFINIQGDEPFVQPEQVNQLASLLVTGAPIVTLVTPIITVQELFSPNIVKVVLNRDNKAMYFSRSPIPFLHEGGKPETWFSQHVYYRHLGMYGYQRTVLEKIIQLLPAPLEKAESLEQLRWLENSYEIHTVLTESATISVDMPEDIKRAEAFLATGK